MQQSRNSVLRTTYRLGEQFLTTATCCIKINLQALLSCCNSYFYDFPIYDECNNLCLLIRNIAQLTLNPHWNTHNVEFEQ